MKFGINVPNFGPGTDPASLAEWVRSAGSAGFDLAMMSDHVAVTPDVAELYPPPFYDPFTTLAWLAGITERIELGTTVTVLPYRNPVLTARMAANIDQISGGRFILGVGVGWSKQEYAALGVPFGRRGAITDEYLAAIGAVVDRGCVIQRRVRVLPQHLHRSLAGPRATPPIWVGGTSTAALRPAVTYGDAWHPNNAELSWLHTEGLPALRSMAAATGRPTPALSPRMRLRLAQAALD